ncbi:MAG TPA: hypothetical protein VIR33_03360 [Thermopolyspora sp.]|jgi:hypothetical protein
MLCALEAEIGIGNGTPAIRRHRDTLAEAYAGRVAEAESATAEETIPTWCASGTARSWPPPGTPPPEDARTIESAPGSGA